MLDRAASSLDSDHSELGLLLEAAAVVAGMNDPVTASSVAVRREALRERATGHPAPPPELLAAAAVISVLTNEPAEVGADLAVRALAGESAPPLGRQAMVRVRDLVLAGDASRCSGPSGTLR